MRVGLTTLMVSGVLVLFLSTGKGGKGPNKLTMGSLRGLRPTLGSMADSMAAK
jgi:hypothetical protein